MINREDMLELTRRMTPARSRIDRIAGAYYDAEGYKYGQYAVGNVFWNVTPNCQLGVEYLYGRRMSMDKSSGHANRIQAMVQYNF